MINNRFFLLSNFVCLLGVCLVGIASGMAQNEATALRIGFYNCENLMDTLDNPEKADDEFTPSGLKHWDSGRYYTKLRQLSKVVMAMGEWEGMALIGLAEVENRAVIDDLLRRTLLRRSGLRAVHFDSPDGRGIDLALLYQPERFRLVDAQPLRVELASKRATRDILWVKGLLPNGDSLVVVLNHWPSRWGGQVDSEPSRIEVAQFLRQWLSVNSPAGQHQIVLGDFNDTPTDLSLQLLTEAADSLHGPPLHNLMLPLMGRGNRGSHLHQGHWAWLDQILVSASLLKPWSSVRVMAPGARAFDAPFLFIDHEGSQQVWRSFRGARYEGGFSDHLPVYLDLHLVRAP